MGEVTDSGLANAATVSDPPRMKVVYVAGPFRADNAWDREQNIRRAEELGLEVAAAGAMPLIPHTNTRHFDGTLTDRFWLDGTLELLTRCDAAIFTPDWQRSTGATRERRLARSLGIPCFDLVSEVRAWLTCSRIRNGG